MTNLFDPDPVADAEQAAKWWAAQRGYVGRRRANEDGTPANPTPAVCNDPDGHAIAYYDVTAWVRHRKATGTCAGCGGMIGVRL